MAVNKVINHSTKSHGAMRNVIEYVLQDKKVRDGYVEIIGPYLPEKITWDGVYNAFLQEKRLWGKDNGRMYAHNIISFHKDEQITPEQCMEIGRRFADTFFSGHQSLISVHQDKDHLHIHIVTNSVSYLTGRKLHQTKHDLDKQKVFTNDLCRHLGLSVNEKGKHFDGSAMEEGEVTAWSKDKYNLLINDSKQSFVTDCAIAVIESKDGCCSKEQFIERMLQHGWHTIWTENKKHITFQNEKGEKVRDSNLAKTFALPISKEELTYEFERQNAERLAAADRDRAVRDARARELDRYYREIADAFSRTDTDQHPVADHPGVNGRQGQNADILPGKGGKAGFGDRREGGSDTAALVREVRDELNNIRSANRAAEQSEAHSIAGDKQRRLAEKSRTHVKKRTDRSR